jgi:hypothetical protein
MSAQANAAAIAAQKEEAAADRAFQLQQQQMALDLYYKNRGDAQSSSNWAAAGNIISRIPTIVSGIGSVYDTVSGWFGDDTDYSGGSSSGDFGYDSDSGFNIPDFDYDYGSSDSGYSLY